MNGLPQYWAVAGTRVVRAADQQNSASLLCEHPGLLLDKYFGYRNAADGYSQKNDQEPHLKAVAECNSRAAREGRLFLAKWKLTMDALRARGPVHTWKMRTVWSLVADGSRVSVLENAGLSFHPTYGFPYLKGNALKGLALSWAQTEAGASEADWKRIFGTSDAGAGTVSFLEAWPEKEKWPELVVETSAPHYGAYYEGGGCPSAPHDSDSPVPYYYLAVAPGTVFQFAVRGDAGSEDDVAQACRWLSDGLKMKGFGAKTGAGHGYMAASAQHE